MSDQPTGNGHAASCDWQLDQYPWECNCGALDSASIVRRATSTFRAGERFGVITASDEPVRFYFERLADEPAR